MEEMTDIKYCLYARKSSEQDERQAMSIESQIKEMEEMAKKENLSVICIKKESHSAKQSGQRPVFNGLIKDIRSDKFTGILTWAPDRLSRNAGDLGSLVDLMDSNKLQRIRTFGQSFSNSPNEKFLLMILCSQAKLENDNKSINVKRGIRAKCEQGIRPGPSPLGYYNRSFNGVKDSIPDPERAPIVKEMFIRASKGQSGRHLKHWLDEIGFRTRRDKNITLSQIFEMLNNPFYYGDFVFGGKLYKGTHEPLISKRLFNLVQEQRHIPQKRKWGYVDLPFKRFLTCAGCGASVVGEEKFKQLKKGGKKRHVYYHCSRKVDFSCKEPYVKEEVIIEELMKLVDNLVINRADCEPGLLRSISKYVHMMRASDPNYRKQDAFRGYARYVLQKGTDFEKARLIRNLRCTLVLKDRKVLSVASKN